METACAAIKKEKTKEKKFIAERNKIAKQVKNQIDLLIKIKSGLGSIVLCCVNHQDDCTDLKYASTLINKDMDSKELSILISHICVKCYTFKQKAFQALVKTKREHDEEIDKIEKLEQEVFSLKQFNFRRFMGMVK